MNKIKVYIASPYTKGDPAVNVKRQIDMADTLMNHGYVPFVPLLMHFQHLCKPRDYQDWIDYDLEWIVSCDCLLRLKGESPGAANEVKEAESLGIPVFYSLSEMNHYYQCSNIGEYKDD
jgi:hypothetical protein